MKLVSYIPIPALFDFHRTALNQTQYREQAGSNLYKAGTYYRGLNWGDCPFVVAARQDGTKIEVTIPGGETEQQMEFGLLSIRQLLSLDVPLDGFYSMLKGDPVLASRVQELWGLRPQRMESVFEALVMAVIGQQISGSVARVIRDEIVNHYGRHLEADGYTIPVFPCAEALIEAGRQGLRSHKLSERKADYILNVARHAQEGLLDSSRFDGWEDSQIIDELTSIRGVGRWTAEWVLMGALGRMDAFPTGDLALRRAVAELYFQGEEITVEQLKEFGELRWRPYRGLVTTYLFARIRKDRVSS